MLKTDTTNFINREILKKYSIILKNDEILHINKYIEILLHWKGKISLISSKDLEAEYFIERFLLQAICLSNLLDKIDGEILDIGSGNGLPAILISILTKKRINCCEINIKKSVFLRDVITKLELEINIHNLDVLELNLKFDIILAQAVSSLVNLCKMMSVVSRETSIGYFLKGQNLEKEILKAKEAWNFSYKVYNVTSESKIIAIQNLCQKKL